MVRKPRRTCSYEYKVPRNRFQRFQMRLQVLTVVSGITSIYIYPSGAAKIARPEVMTAYSPTYRYALPESLQSCSVLSSNLLPYYPSKKSMHLSIPMRTCTATKTPSLQVPPLQSPGHRANVAVYKYTKANVGYLLEPKNN